MCGRSFLADFYLGMRPTNRPCEVTLVRVAWGCIRGDSLFDLVDLSRRTRWFAIFPRALAESATGKDNEADQ